MVGATEAPQEWDFSSTSPAEVLNLVERICAGLPDISLARTDTATIEIRRLYRPRWIRTTAVVAALPTLGLALLLLRIRTRHECRLTATADARGGTRASLVGRMEPAWTTALQGTLVRSLAARQPDGAWPDERFGAVAGSSGDNAVIAAVPGVTAAPALPAVEEEPVRPSVGAAPARPTLDVGPPAAGPSAVALTVSAARLRQQRREAAARHGFVLRADTGQRVGLHGFTLVGRDPERGADDPMAQVVAITDPDRTVSKTHASVEVVADTVWVSDRHSTNGSRIHTPDGATVTCRPGQPQTLSVGSTWELGQRRLVLERELR